MNLRIRRQTRENRNVIAIDGELLRDGLTELNKACSAVRGDFLLDLTDMTGADDEGIAVLHELQAAGAEIVSASPYIRLLLERRGRESGSGAPA